MQRGVEHRNRADRGSHSLALGCSRSPWDWRSWVPTPASGCTGLIRKPSIGRGVMGEQRAVCTSALGDYVGQPAPQPEDACPAGERLPDGGPEERRLEVDGDPSLVGAAAGGDGEVDRHVGGGHEDRPADPTTRPLELVAIRRVDRALARAQRAHAEAVVHVESGAGEPALHLGTPLGGNAHWWPVLTGG
jgi:hypothetical protein